MRERGFKLGKLQIKRCIVAMSLMICMVVMTCTNGVQVNAETQKQAQEDFDTYLEELFLSEVALNTVNLHYTLAYPENYGITDYEVTLGDFSMESFEDGNK